MSYDFPDPGGDLDDESNWREGFKGLCERAGYQDDCLTVDVDLFEKLPDGSREEIDNPGPGYGAVYSTCVITTITPRPGTEVTVPGTVTIEVECTRPEAPDPDPTAAP